MTAMANGHINLCFIASPSHAQASTRGVTVDLRKLWKCPVRRS